MMCPSSSPMLYIISETSLGKTWTSIDPNNSMILLNNATYVWETSHRKSDQNVSHFMTGIFTML